MGEYVPEPREKEVEEIEVTPEMIEAAAVKVAGHLRRHEIDSPSLCSEIAEDVLRAGLHVVFKKVAKT